MKGDRMEDFNKFMSGFFTGVLDVVKVAAAIGGVVLTGKKLLKK